MKLTRVSAALMGLLAATVGVQGLADLNSKDVNPYNYHTLTVEGRGAVDIYTDDLIISMTVSKSNDCKGMEEDDPKCDSSALQQQVNDITSKLVTTFSDNEDVISISSGGVSLQPQYTYDDTIQASVFTGYTSSIQLTAIVKGDYAGEFLNQAVTMGVNDIGGIDYFISDEQMKTSQEQALKLASEDAMGQAEAVLAVMGSEVTQIKSVNVPFMNSPIQGNGPVDLEHTNGNSSSLTAAVKTVGYSVKLRLKYS